MTPRELKKLMDAMKLSKPELAGELGVHVATVYRWLSGESKIDGPAAKAIRNLAEKAGTAA